MPRLLYIFLFSLLSFQGLAQPLPELIPYTNGSKWGYADTTGRVVIQPQWVHVNLFIGDKATVSVRDAKDTVRFWQCLIDKKGDCIIPPSRRWNGQYEGWKGAMNVQDTNGKWGMIDTFNNLLIPHEWHGAQKLFHPRMDSLYKVVNKGGLVGLIDRNNRVIVPNEYESIFCIGVEPSSLFVVRAAKRSDEYNSYGVVDSAGNVVLPVRYHDIYYEETALGNGFRVSIAVPRKGGGMYDREYKWKWIDRQTGKETDYDERRQNAYKYVNDHGYIRFYNAGGGGFGLMDTSHKVLIPCCKMIELTADTIKLTSSVTKGDSVIMKTSYLHTDTRKPYVPEQTTVYYQKQEHHGIQEGMCGNYYRAMAEERQYIESLPKVSLPGWREEREFFKDSLLLNTRSVADDGPFPRFERGIYYEATYTNPWSVYSPEFKYINVVGYGTGAYTRGAYTAITDRQGNYVVPPMPQTELVSYNEHDSLVTVHPYGSFSMVLNSRGDTVIPVIKPHLTGAFRWKGKLYTYVVKKEKTEREEGEYPRSSTMRTVVLGDSAGNELPYFAKYEVAAVQRNSKGEFIALIMRDSANRLAIMNPDGTAPYPKLNFKYKRFILTEDDLILAFPDDNNNKGKLITHANKDLFPGRLFNTLSKATYIPYNTQQWQSTVKLTEAPGLYQLYETHPQDVNAKLFYVDRWGRGYGR